ncbi:hypothetical protein JI664_02660 [Rhodobacter sp. NTK016B]|uniref:DUF6525 family protein n=1 Tax=Rhodobacter sp. NTK016B TaxID=2759676 RepID=UPI001A8F4007|nr:DUF6525 family protein [Rhodobacter sp. NTK016B]MBN8290857.1 hypothetical protein [Rhodobacter sp. NTK016B]
MTARNGNLRCSLKRRAARGNPMTAFDRLPPELRGWLSQAALPWSPHSALKLWRRSLAKHNGDTEQVLAHLSRAERAMLLRDAPAVWGREGEATDVSGRSA